VIFLGLIDAITFRLLTSTGGTWYEPFRIAGISRQHPHRGCFPCPIGAGKSEDLAFIDMER
jgi:hypothetical protein